MYTCNCGKKFEKQRSLNTHARFCTEYVKKNKNSIYVTETGYICECGKQFEKSQSLNSHFRSCLVHRKGVPITYKNSGWHLSDESRARGGRTLSDNIKSGKTVASQSGKKWNEERKLQMSIIRTKFLEENPNSNIKWYLVSNGIRDIKVQGEWELKVANWLNEREIFWDRKKLMFGTYSYTPDFYLSDNLLIEVKGWMKDRDLFKMRKFLESNPQFSILLIEKEELQNLHNLCIEDLQELRLKYDLENVDETKFVTYSDIKTEDRVGKLHLHKLE